jgi:NAD(P)-dependent dehydrogenase (short-subunit alcohol dehydrogenase family)
MRSSGHIIAPGKRTGAMRCCLGTSKEIIMEGDKVLDPRGTAARRFEGKVCVVAGAGQGIGSATARRLAQEGGTLVLGDWVEESVRKVCDEVTDFGSKGTFHVGNYSLWEDCEALMRRAADSFGRIDVLVVVVGGTIFFQSLQLYTPEQIVAEVNKSLWPNLWCVRAVLPYMIEQKSGSIVTLGSNVVGGKFRAPYAAAKGGVIGFTQSLSKEIAEYGIRINCVAPSNVASTDRVTPRNHGVDIPRNELPPEERELQRLYRESDHWQGQPLTRFRGFGSTAEEQAAAIAFFASEDASFISGQVLAVVGGETFP